MVRGGLLQAKVLPAQASIDPGKPLSPPANVRCAQGAGLGLREAGGGLGQAVPSSCQMTPLARKPRARQSIETEVYLSSKRSWIPREPGQAHVALQDRDKG